MIGNWFSYKIGNMKVFFFVNICKYNNFPYPISRFKARVQLLLVSAPTQTQTPRHNFIFLNSIKLSVGRI